MDGLNMGIISNLEFDLPDIKTQKDMQISMHEIEQMMNYSVQAKVKEEALMASLQSRAFSGELTLRDLEAVL